MTSESITETNSDDRSRWLALYVLCAGVLMIVLDATVVNVALPTIQDDLDFTNANLAWVVNAYLIAFGGSLLLAGRLGDLIGKRAIFLSGMAIFTGLSLICGLAPTQEVLIGARFFQGVGGAMTAAVALGMIVTMFPEPREQAKAIGVYAFVASAGGSVGLLAGGVLTQALSWHWIFFVNIPIGIATAVMAIRLVHKDKGIGLAGGADLPGAVLIVSSLMLGVYTIVSPAEQKGWGDSLTLGLGALTLLLLAAFIWREATARNPLVPLRIFRSRNVSGANIVQALSVVGMFGVFFMGALYLQRVLGYDALETGLAFLPTTICMGTLSIRYSERLITRFGGQRVTIAGLVAMVIGLVIFTTAPVDGGYFLHVFPVMVFLGLGAGMAFPALAALAMSGATPQDAGLASGLVNTSAQVGGAIGLALLATFSASRTESLIDGGTSTLEALNGGYHLAYWIGAATIVVAIVVAALVLEPVAAPSGEPGDETGDGNRQNTTGEEQPDYVMSEFG